MEEEAPMSEQPSNVHIMQTATIFSSSEALLTAVE